MEVSAFSFQSRWKRLEMRRDLEAMVLVWGFWKGIGVQSGAAELKTVRHR
jgi:hypothetical protein